MIRIAVCDDEQHVLDEISQMTATYMRNCNFNFQIDTFCISDGRGGKVRGESGIGERYTLAKELTEKL